MKKNILFFVGLFIALFVFVSTLSPVQILIRKMITNITYGPAIADCEKRGGYWRNDVAIGCFIPIKDRGKICHMKSDCESACLFLGAAPDTESYLIGSCGEDSIETCEQELLFPDHKIKNRSELIPGIEGCA